MKRTALLFAPAGPLFSAEGIVTEKFITMLENQGWLIYWIYHNNDQIPNKKSNYIGINNRILINISTRLRQIPFLNQIKRIDSFIWVLKAYIIGKRILKTENINIIFSRIMPAYGHLPALFLSKKYEIKWIANWSDPMPRIKAPIPYGNGAKANISFLSILYLKQICKNASYHSFPSEELKKHYQLYCNIEDYKSIILPHISLQIKLNPSKTKHNNSTLTISHIGGGLRQRNPSFFFQALSKIIQMPNYKTLDIRVLFVGQIEGDIINAIKASPLKDIVFLRDKVTYIDSLYLINNSDIILLLEANMENGIFLPSKLSDIVAIGKPLLAISPKKGTVKRLLTDYGGGIVVDCNSINDIENGLKTIIDDWITDKCSNNRYSPKALQKLFSSETVYSTLSKYL